MDLGALEILPDPVSQAALERRKEHLPPIHRPPVGRPGLMLTWLLTRKNGATIPQIAHGMEMTKYDVSRVIGNLMKRGFAKFTGNRRTRTYYAPELAPAGAFDITTSAQDILRQVDLARSEAKRTHKSGPKLGAGPATIPAGVVPVAIPGFERVSAPPQPAPHFSGLGIGRYIKHESWATRALGVAP